MRPRATRGQFLAAGLCGLLGFAVVVQAHQAQVQSLGSLRQADLISVLDNVTQQSARLEDQARTLQANLDALRSGGRSPAALEAARARAQILAILAGTVPATGPGIELEITDPRAAVGAAILLETLQELRDAGAEAVQMGKVGVVASTSFVDDPKGVLIDGTLTRAPYRLLVIGESQTLGAALEIPGGVLETLRGKGAQGRVTPGQGVVVDALRPLAAPQYAHPAQGTSP
jgi:uncharacterized protein YlxW (UPF0749 family)